MASSRGWQRTVEVFVFVVLVSLGATTIVTASWALDYDRARAVLLGSDRGVSLLVTAGSARVLIVSGTDPSALGNALSKSRHPGLDRIDLLIVSGNAGAANMAARAIQMVRPRMVITVGSEASLVDAGRTPDLVITRATEVELPHGVEILVDVWPAAQGENDDVTWSARVERAGASVYWVSDRETLMLESLPEEADVTVIGRGRPADDTPFPSTNTVVVAGESISGPEFRRLIEDVSGAETTTLRIFSDENVRIGLDPDGIDAVDGAIAAASPVANESR